MIWFKVVPDSSSHMLGYSNIEIHANHMDMARFSDKSAQGYKHVSRVILGWVEYLSPEGSRKEISRYVLGD
jgi:hypothetical protein